MQVGKYKIDIIKDNSILIDGGMLLAGLDKEDWVELIKPELANRVRIGVNFLLIRGEGINLLVDTGLGTKINPKRCELLGLKNLCPMSDLLSRFELTPDDITHVVFSHLHFDHCAGATEIIGEEVLPVFKNAIHIVQEEEWQAAVAPSEFVRHGYFFKDFLPLLHDKRLSLINGNVEIFENLFLEVTGGHTKGHQLVRIKENKESFLYLADLCPTPLHLCAERREAFDLLPLDTIEAKKRFLRVAAKHSSVLAFSHDLEGCFYKIEEENNCYRCLKYEA